MAPPSNSTLGKRKQAPDRGPGGRQHKRTKLQDARTIASQTSGQAFGNGELDVDRFVQARAFEIKALEKGIKKSKSVLSSRAFQSVPRELRRRTASHNVKRVPKRLRARAEVEMQEDNTPTVNTKTKKAKTKGKSRLRLQIAGRKQRESLKTRAKKLQRKLAKQGQEHPEKVSKLLPNKLQHPPKPKAKFRKRQRFKAWLPTHIFHAKRAHMPPAKEPPWRMAIPLSPTQKCYRSTHRSATTKGAVAWDKSYMSTIGLDGAEQSIVGLLKGLSVEYEHEGAWWEKKASHWMSGTRIWEGWVFERDTRPRRPIAPVSILWQVQYEDAEEPSGAPKQKHPRRQAFIRVHPSAFFQLWNEMLLLAKIQKPTVAVEDLRFEIGSIEVRGPAAAEALVGTLWPIQNQSVHKEAKQAPEIVWQKLRSLSSASHLPRGASLGFDIVDPRLHHPPRTIDKKLPGHQQRDLMKITSTWPVDKTQTVQLLFDRRARVLASRQLPSQKSINRRKGDAPPGAYPDPKPSDPRVPLVVLTHGPLTEGQDCWTVLLPWKCVLPVWYSLMFYPLSSGGTLRFGGLNQTRQLAFEADTAWFPGDYPGTQAGKTWEAIEQQKRKAEWERFPQGRRVEYDSLDLGQNRKGEIGVGWACDWDRLLTQAQPEPNGAEASWKHVPRSEATKMLQSNQPNGEPPVLGLAVVAFSMVQRGIASTCARVYRLPTMDMDLRKRWLKNYRVDGRQKSRGMHTNLVKDRVVGDMVQERRERLAAMLLREPDGLRNDLLVVPDEIDLIGFVTTGNFNLTMGKGTGIANIVVDKVTRLPLLSPLSKEEYLEHRSLCIVRESGEKVARLARWKLA